jgi:hypothetical protein
MRSVELTGLGSAHSGEGTRRCDGRTGLVDESIFVERGDRRVGDLAAMSVDVRDSWTSLD